jgi:uncharacterized membrane protein
MYQFDEDLAIYDQIVWNTAHGQIFASTLIQHATNLLGDHFTPAIAIFVPIYWLVPTPNVLLIGQTVLLAAAAIPLFLWVLGEGRGPAPNTQHPTPNPLVATLVATLVAAAYLVYPPLHYVNLYQFHEIAMLPLPLATALLALERGQRRLFFGAAVACLLVKEEVAFVVVGLGLLWLARRRDVRMAALTIGLAVVAGVVIIGIILPHGNNADSGQAYYYVRRYAYLGSTPLQIAFTALTSPGLVASHLLTPDRLSFLAKLFLPLGLLPLLGWEYLLGAAPVFGYLLLADDPSQYAIDRHYLAPLLPFLFFGAALGLTRLARGIGSWLRGITPPPTPSPARRGGDLTAAQRPSPTLLVGEGIGGGVIPAILLSVALLALGLASEYRFGPTPFGRAYNPEAFTPSPHTAELQRLVAQVPAGASVAASRNLLSWFSERNDVYRYPDLNGADYVLVDWRDLRYPMAFAMDNQAFGALLASPSYRFADSAGGAVFLVRGDPNAVPADTSAITRFGDQIDLLDYHVRPAADASAVDLTLTWRALRPLATRYTIFVHVLGPGQQLLGQKDSWPLDNLYPTDLWQPGRIVPDTHTIPLKAPLPAAGYQIEFGLYDANTGSRLPITERGLPGGGDSVVLAVR